MQITPKKKRKFDRGRTPCSYCDGGNHKKCRPRLDATLCSCSCRWARLMRSEMQVAKMVADNHGEAAPGIEEIALVLRPRYRAHWKVS